jgi:hypothetical protein
MSRRWHILMVALALVGAAGCSVRQIPLRPVLEPAMDENTPKARGEVVALIMDPRVSDFVRERDFSLTQEERYASGSHFMRSLLVQLRARGLNVLEVESEEQGANLGASWVLIPDTPGVNVIRPKGVLDFSFLGSLNRISVSYGVRALKAGARIPERVSGSGSRTASFFWSNALLQSVGLGALGLMVSSGIYAVYYGFLISQNVRAGKTSVREYLQPPSPAAAIAVLIADLLVSQITAQVFPRFINPLVDLLVNEPRWEVMVQDAHDEALQACADNVVRKVTGGGR